MTADERRQQLVEFLAQRGFADLSAMVSELNVSDSTIRRDLGQLEQEGMIRRTHGGAVFISDRYGVLNYTERELSSAAEKRAIGRAAADLIVDGDVILLDGGTTTFQVARHLVGRHLQVVTNSLPIAQLLGSLPDIELTFVGGYIYPRTGVALGPLAKQMLESIHVNKAFMGAAGVTEKGLFNATMLMAEVDRRMMESADEVVVVVDHTKFGKSALACLGGMDLVDKMICDQHLDPRWQQVVRDAGVELILAEIDTQDRQRAEE
jgi:DeoR family transcriptional regulator, fructose operon transcriptional repressor